MKERKRTPRSHQSRHHLSKQNPRMRKMMTPQGHGTDLETDIVDEDAEDDQEAEAGRDAAIMMKMKAL